MRNRIGGAILALAAVFGIFAATSTTTQAQWRNDDGRYNRRDRDDDDDDRRWRRNQDRRNDRYGRNNSRVELNQGYQYGIHTGASDAQRRQSFSPQRSHYYRNASSQAFREGFVRGYDQGYRQYVGNGNGRYGNGRYENDDYGNGRYGNGSYNNNAELNRGYQQAIETGASDGQRGQSYDPQRSRHYRNASTQAFREGFVRGYDQGYRQYSNGSNRNSNGGGIADILGSILGRP